MPIIYVGNLAGESGGKFLSESGTDTYEVVAPEDAEDGDETKTIAYMRAHGEVTLDVCTGNIEGLEGRTLSDGEFYAGNFTKITVSGDGDLLVIRKQT